MTDVSDFEIDLRQALDSEKIRTYPLEDGRVGVTATIGEYFPPEEDDTHGMVVQFFMTCIPAPAPSNLELGYTYADIAYESGVKVIYVKDGEQETPVYAGDVQTVEDFVAEFELSPYMAGRLGRLFDHLSESIKPSEKSLDELSSQFFGRYAIDTGIYDTPLVN